jgi:hypothetical protein
MVPVALAADLTRILETNVTFAIFAIHETEASYCYRIRCMAAREEYCGTLSRIALNAQEKGSDRILPIGKMFAFVEILELLIWEGSVDASGRVSG